MPARSEVLDNGTVCSQETLNLPWGLDPCIRYPNIIAL